MNPSSRRLQQRAQIQRWRRSGGWLKVRILACLVQFHRAYTHTRKGTRMFNLEQRLNDSATSTASPGEHHTFYAHIATLNTSDYPQNPHQSSHPPSPTSPPGLPYTPPARSRRPGLRILVLRRVVRNTGRFRQITPILSLT